MREALRGHRVFASVLAVGALLRVVAMLGYRPALWFNDSYDYVRIALDPFAHPIRPAGYGIFLWLLKPFHSFVVVVGVQHLLGLATGALVYLLLRRRGLPGWGATPASAPVLLDGNVIELETLILSDTLFLFLVVAALTALLWNGRRGLGPLVAGLLLAGATLTRTIGLPVLLLVLLALLAGRRWRALGTVAAAGLLPLAAYAMWFHAAHDRYALTATDGVFLWGRDGRLHHLHRHPGRAAVSVPARRARRTQGLLLPGLGGRVAHRLDLRRGLRPEDQRRRAAVRAGGDQGAAARLRRNRRL